MTLRFLVHYFGATSGHSGQSDNRVLLPSVHRRYFWAFLNVGTLCWPTVPALFNPSAPTSGLPVTRARIIKKASVKQQWSISLRRVDGPIRSQAHPTIISFNRESHSSRRSIAGSTDSARCAGIHVAISPSNAIARTVPVNTRGSRGVA